MAPFGDSQNAKPASDPDDGTENKSEWTSDRQHLHNLHGLKGSGAAIRAFGDCKNTKQKEE